MWCVGIRYVHEGVENSWNVDSFLPATNTRRYLQTTKRWHWSKRDRERGREKKLWSYGNIFRGIIKRQFSYWYGNNFNEMRRQGVTNIPLLHNFCSDENEERQHLSREKFLLLLTLVSFSVHINCHFYGSPCEMKGKFLFNVMSNHWVLVGKWQ